MTILCNPVCSVPLPKLRPSHTYHCCHGFHLHSTVTSTSKILRDYKSKQRERGGGAVFTQIFHGRLQLDIKDSEYGEVQRKSRLLAALKELYSCGQAAAAVSAAERESIEPPSCVQDKQLDQPTLVNANVHVCIYFS